MARCPLLTPSGPKRINLSLGDYLDVKQELNTGEYRKMIEDQSKESAGRFVVNLERLGITRVLAYVVGWSFVDLEGQPLPITFESLKRMRIEEFTEVLEATDAHHERCEQEMEARKNGKGGATGSSAISPSAA